MSAAQPAEEPVAGWSLTPAEASAVVAFVKGMGDEPARAYAAGEDATIRYIHQWVTRALMAEMELEALKKALPPHQEQTAHLAFDASGRLLPCACEVRDCEACRGGVDAHLAARGRS